MQLTKHFTLDEFAVSSSFPDIAAQIVFDDDDVIKSFYLCRTILEPTRKALRLAYHSAYIKITNGKRSNALQAALKTAGYNPSPTSDHNWIGKKIGADFLVYVNKRYSKTATKAAYEFIKEQLPHAFGQCIFYEKKGHCHVSLPTDKNQSESWIQNG